MSTGQSNHYRDKKPTDAVGQFLDRRFAPLGFLNQPNNLGQRSVLSYFGSLKLNQSLFILSLHQ